MLPDMVDLERLEPKSREFAAQLLRSRPELRRHAREESLPGGERYLLLSIPLASGRPERLVADTGDRSRIVLRLGGWSAEFHAPAQGGRSSQLSAALDLLEEFLDGQVQVWIRTRAGRFMGSGVLRASGTEQRLALTLAPGERLEVLSFDGSRDALHERHPT
jgi:hypothetical protein